MLTASVGRRTIDIRKQLHDAALDGMSFLTSVVSEYPDAISFAPGRPLDTLLHTDGHLADLAPFVATWAQRRRQPVAAVWQQLGQYGRTNGLIADVIVEQLARDEQIQVSPEAVLVTVGAQEALAILLAGLFEPSTDCLLVGDPTYVGITALARLLGIRVVPIATDDEGLNPVAVERAIVRQSHKGRVRALYDIPDFSNPLGTSLSVSRRRALLEVCSRHGVFIIEDNPYGMFRYEGERIPTLKALDADASVLYVGSFSKTLFPGLRLGYLVADQRVAPGGQPLAMALTQVKNLFTINTSPISQAIVAGALHQSGGSLETIVAPKRAQYKRQRDAMQAALRQHFADLRELVSWAVPAGGFFLPMTLPFAFGRAQLRRCAATYGVIVTPMSFFSSAASARMQVRLAFSSAEPDRIACGIERFAAFVRDQRNETQSFQGAPRFSNSCLA